MGDEPYERGHDTQLPILQPALKATGLYVSRLKPFMNIKGLLPRLRINKRF